MYLAFDYILQIATEHSNDSIIKRWNLMIESNET